MTSNPTTRRAGLILLGGAAIWLITSAAGRRASEARTAQQGAKATTGDQFVDVAAKAGIHFTLTSGGPEKRYIIEAKGGGGIAWIDYNNDGFPDLFLVNGSTFEDWKRRDSPRSRLYRNNGDGTFTDVSDHSGLDRTGWGMGACVGDYDNDGFDDLYVTYYGGNVLYHNNGDGTFTDVTGKTGTGGPGGHTWSMGCAFGDYDRDGYLDLYVANYLDVDIEKLGEPGSAPNCTYRGIATFCGPRGLPGGRDMLFHNNRNGTFTDVTEHAGIDPERYAGLGVVWCDYDRDGHPDIYVANDSTPSSLYHNNGDGTFTDVAVQAGVAYSAEGQEEAGMGTDFADYDNDGWGDLVKGNFSDDVKNLYHNNHDGTFTDVTYLAGLGDAGWLFTTFGAKFLDYDNDGWKDIFLADGQTFPQMDKYPSGITYAERNLLFHNRGDGKFDEVGLRSGPGLATRKVSRGLATADYDNDGDLEIAVSHMNDSPDLLRHERKNRNHSILIKTIGTRSNRDGIGTEVKVVAGKLTQYDTVRSGGSYLSSSDLRLHFGLGSATRIDRLEFRWPAPFAGGAASTGNSGQPEVIENLPVDCLLVIKEGEGVVVKKPLRKLGP
ncbi:MAG TPA: CRTAC1 family protein [Terriglobia bacterium]